MRVMLLTFDVTQELMSWSNKEADSNIALMSTTLLVSQPEISALKSGYWEKAFDMFVTRLVSQLGIGPKLAEVHIPSVSCNPGVFHKHSEIAYAKLKSDMVEFVYHPDQICHSDNPCRCLCEESGCGKHVI
ncbi:unnamed protein product [Bathycoccus prasinos]